MPDYQKGKIYKITSGDLIYIGSTTSPTLARRLAQHVSSFKTKKRITSSYQLIETGQYEIILVELCPCNSKDELHARERFHIENTVCVNKVIPTRTKIEYYNDNQTKILEQRKEYRKTHQEQEKEYREATKEQKSEYNKLYSLTNHDKIKSSRIVLTSIKYTCVCGCEYSYTNKARHETSKKHQAFISS